MRPEVFRLEKNFENRQKHQKRRSACVGQADFGKLELKNIRNDSGNSQRLSVLSVKRDQFETRSIRNKRGRMFRPFALSWTDEGTTIRGHFKAFTHPLPPPGLACVMQDLKL